ncbi:hypothetical protein [Dickeya sp. CFBP 2040]
MRTIRRDIATLQAMGFDGAPERLYKFRGNSLCPLLVPAMHKI